MMTHPPFMRRGSMDDLHEWGSMIVHVRKVGFLNVALKFCTLIKMASSASLFYVVDLHVE